MQSRVSQTLITEATLFQRRAADCTDMRKVCVFLPSDDGGGGDGGGGEGGGCIVPTTSSDSNMKTGYSVRGTKLICI